MDLVCFFLFVITDILLQQYAHKNMNTFSRNEVSVFPGNLQDSKAQASDYVEHVFLLLALYDVN